MRFINAKLYTLVGTPKVAAIGWMVACSLTPTGWCDDGYWAAKYSRFGGGKPPVGLEATVERFFAHTIVPKGTINADNLAEAFEQLRELLRAAKAEYGLGYTTSLAVDTPKRFYLQIDGFTLAQIIDQLAMQGAFRWDFSAAGMLTLSRKPVEQRK